jgi:hypothetical protein
MRVRRWASSPRAHGDRHRSRRASTGKRHHRVLARISLESNQPKIWQPVEEHPDGIPMLFLMVFEDHRLGVPKHRLRGCQYGMLGSLDIHLEEVYLR